MKDYYDILGVPPNASKEDIKRAYRILATQFHPDKNNGNEERFKEVLEAYRILSLESSRSQYDREYNASQADRKNKTEKEEVEKTFEGTDFSKKTFIIPVAISILFVAVLIVIVTINKSSNISTTTETGGNTGVKPFPQPMPPAGPIDTPPVTPKTKPITNPDYLKNQSAYLVDQGNTTESQTPTDKPLWVEEVVDSAVLGISYPIVKDGQNIIVVKHLGIPGLSQHQFHPPILKTLECAVPINCMEIAIECTEKASIDFMKKYLLQKEVYLNPEEIVLGTIKGWRLLMFDSSGKNKIDVAQFVSQNGYGYHYVQSPGGFTYTPLTTSESIEKEKKRLDSLSYSSYQEKTLQDVIAVARLAKRGFWGTCQ